MCKEKRKYGLILEMRYAFLIAGVLLFTLAAHAQQDDVHSDDQELEQLPEVREELETPPSTLPDDDVMKPTDHVVRFTPKMARGMARHMAEEMAGSDLPEDQQREFQERLARRMMNVGHQHGQDVAPFFQTMMSQMFTGQGKIPAEAGQEIGRLGEKAAPAIRTFADGLADDARPYVTPEKYQELLAEEEKMRKGADRIQEEMAKWARGELPEGDQLENPFELMEDAMDDDGETPEAPPDDRSEVRQQLDRQVEWSYWQKMPQGWRWFLRNVRRTCDFTDEQNEQARAILRDYERRAEELTTEEWKERMRHNRLLFQSQYHLQDPRTEEITTNDGQMFQVPVQAKNIEPWLFQINLEYQQMTAPLDEMKQAFTREILALVTPEQRERVSAEIRTLAASHGMEPTAAEDIIKFLFTPSGDISVPAPEAPDQDAASAPEAADEPAGDPDTSLEPAPAP